jgi:hypothetical protein
MSQERSLDTLDDVRIELVVHRLVIRAVLAYLACTTGEPAGQIVAEICGMLEGTGPYAVTAEDIDAELKGAAIDRARKRMASFAAAVVDLPVARSKGFERLRRKSQPS